MSELFPRALLVEAFPNSPRMVSAFEKLGDAIESAQATIARIQADADSIILSGYQPRSAILDALSDLAASQGAIEQTAAGAFTIRPIDNDADTASLLSRARADTLYTPL